MLTVMLAQPTALQITWYVLIAVLWIGFFFLEGFDFGVSMLYPILGRDPKERRVMINTIGPTWDGNEVWLLTAGGATFAAFPGWYATMFSALYLPLFLVLFGLIIRGVSFEYRAKVPDDTWHNAFDWAATIGSFVVALVFGVGFANFIQGIPLAANTKVFGNPMLYSGNFFGLFTPFTLLGGVMLVLMCMLHGGVFLSLKTYGTVHEKTSAFTRRLAPIVAIVLLAYVLCANIFYGANKNPWLNGTANVGMWVTGVLAVAALGVTILAHQRHRDGWAFIGTGVSMVLLFAMTFVKMYGTLGLISADPNAFNFTIAASSAHTLRLMTISTACILPIVLAYQVWSYWVFRRRISTKEIPDEVTESQLNPSPAGA